ncbi:MAG: hypothetical protein VKK59_02350 [Vampirovibrionales bacterium]|nr:hypothetical protein [Vampirovibrionales bacterium]
MKTLFAAALAASTLALSLVASAEPVQIVIKNDADPQAFNLAPIQAELTSDVEVRIVNQTQKNLTFLVPGTLEETVAFNSERTVTIPADKIDAKNGIKYVITGPRLDYNYYSRTGMIVAPPPMDPTIAERDARFQQFSDNSRDALQRLIASNNYTPVPAYVQQEPAKAAPVARKLKPAPQPRAASVRGYW